MMKLWLLERTEIHGYDEYCGFVIRAEDEASARAIAVVQAGDEGAGAWMSQARSTCIELQAEGESGMVLGDFNAG